MSFYDVKTGLWSETDPRTDLTDTFIKQFPNTEIITRSDGVIEVQKVVSDVEKTALSATLTKL